MESPACSTLFMFTEIEFVAISSWVYVAAYTTEDKVPLIESMNLRDYNLKANNLRIQPLSPYLPESHHLENSGREILPSLFWSKSFKHSSSSAESSGLPSSLATSASSLLSMKPLASLSKEVNTFDIISLSSAYACNRYDCAADGSWNVYALY